VARPALAERGAACVGAVEVLRRPDQVLELRATKVNKSAYVQMFHYAILRTTAHSTEDVSRVLDALELFLPPAGTYTLDCTNIEGHYGNILLLLQVKMKGSKNMNYFIDLIKTRLSAMDLMRLRSELPERVDEECVLHMRFDKQRAFRGEPALATTQDFISVQLKVRVYPASKQKAIETISGLF